jgi:hypothetical protein
LPLVFHVVSLLSVKNGYVDAILRSP